MSESLLAVLDREPIRLIDGRYSTGFANVKDLQKLIDMGSYVEVYENQGVRFVRKHIVPAAQLAGRGVHPLQSARTQEQRPKS